MIEPAGQAIDLRAWIEGRLQKLRQLRGLASVQQAAQRVCQRIRRGLIWVPYEPLHERTNSRVWSVAGVHVGLWAHERKDRPLIIGAAPGEV